MAACAPVVLHRLSCDRLTVVLDDSSPVPAVVRTMPPPVRLAGLDPDRTYQVEHMAAPGEVLGWGRQPAWLTDGPVAATGS